MTAQHAAFARGSQISLPLQLSIGDIEDGDIGVAPPTIAEADDDRVVDLGTFEGNATLHVDAWPLMAAGQRYWLTAIAGTEKYVVADDALVTGPATLHLPLPRAWLEDLADGTSFDIELAIAFGGGELATAKRFTSAAYTLRREGPDTGWAGIEYVYESLDQYKSLYIYVRKDQPYTLRFATLYNLYGSQTVTVNSGVIDCWAGPTLANTRLVLDYPIPRLDVSMVNPPNSVEIVAHDSAGGEIVRQPLVQNNTLWAGSSTGIRSFEFTSNAHPRLYIDNIKVWTGSRWRELSTPLIEDFAHWPMEEHDRRFDAGNWSIAGDTCAIAVTPYPTDPQRRTLRFSRMQDTSSLSNYLVHLTPRGLVTPNNKVSVKIRRERATGDHLYYVKAMLAYSNTTNAIEDSGREADSLRIVGPITHTFTSTELEHVMTFAALEQMPLPGERLAFIHISMQFTPSLGWVPVFIDEIAIE
ncbi:hypothetical protein [Luteibacter sp. 329MFSha]|uniref:hypothetical protein n=1 Tax=Luteibacter sp. 329MFSha TaxID=1798239 RepID=UPI0008CD4B7D|nr:hypothetical protein [Luteibacter sp. 329MFSha]SEV93986.1 hypothetical protein SAMN04515660_1149 [Luteibacter sp. 329MFSha]